MYGERHVRSRDDILLAVPATRARLTMSAEVSSTVGAANVAANRDEFDPYRLDPGATVEPPRTLVGALRRIGPGMVLAASVVGSGELIATTTLGAKVGYSALWLIVLSCLIKPFTQEVLGRYTVATGETALES